MSKMRLSLMVLSVLALPCALVASDYYVASGETRTVSVRDGLAGENISHRIYISDGGTLKMTNPPSSGAAALYQYVIASNGVCTIDVTECAGHAIRFAHGIRAWGELRVVGTNEVHLGRTRPQGDTHLSIYDIPRVTFVEADGVTEYASGRVVVDQMSTLIAMPTNAGTEWSIADGIEVGLAGEPLFGLSDDYTLGDYDVLLMNPSAFKTGATLRVHSGRSLAIKPCIITADLRWNPSARGWTATNNIALGGGGARLSLRSVVSFGLAGDITGSGDIVEEYSGTPSLDIPLSGNFGFTGRVMVQRANYTLRLIGGSAEGANLQFRAAEGSSICFLPNSGTCTVEGVATNVHVNAASGCVVNADIAPGGATVHASGGTLNLGLDMMGWTNDVSVNLWLDANVLTSMNAVTNSSGVVQSHEGYTVYDKWWDCRQTEPGDRFTYNNRAYLTGTWQDGINWVYPRRNPTGGPNGLACIYTQTTCTSGAKSGRLYFFDEGLRACGGDISTATNSARFAIMVYGSEYGGGYSIVGSPSYAFGRPGCTKDDGVFKDTTIPLWIDGERIADPSRTGLSGGWQIIAFENGDRTINSLGWKNLDGAWGGGQQYGEIILLDEAPSDDVRRKIELYLATKWGLLANLNGGTAEPKLSVTAIGSGALAVPSTNDLELAGAFDGTLAMNGGAHAHVGAKAVPSADELPRNGLLAWFDPDLAESVVLETEPTKPNLIGYIYDRDPTRRSGTSRLLYINETSAAKPVVGDRCPYWYEGNWGDPFVPTRHWIDNNNYYDEENVLGNAFRLRQAGNRMGTDADGMLDVRTVIMAQNSVRGGGTPIVGAYMGQDGVTRNTTVVSAALWGSAAPAALKGASVWVNGVQTANVTASPSGFTGKPEVLSIETAADYSICAFGLFYNSQYSPMSANHGEIFGEIMLWSSVLAEADRTDVEAYLGRKWTGIVPSGYGDFRSLAVSGASSVVASSLALLPTAAAGFDGDMSVSSAIGKFTFVGGAGSHVVNPVSLASAALTLPSSVTLTVDFTAKPEIGVYPLVTAGSIVGAETLTLAPVGASAGGNRLLLAKDNGTIALRVVPGGVTVIIR